MPEGPATILGGLPVWAEVSFYRGDGYSTDDDADVDALYWRKRDGSKGAPLPDHMYERLEAKDAYWECNVIEAVCDYLAHEQYERELMDVRCKHCKGTGQRFPSPCPEPGNVCRRCRGTGTFVSRVRAGLSDYCEFT